MVGEPTGYPASGCDCLTLSVRDVESFARGPVSRAIEHLVIRVFIGLAGTRSRRIRIPDLSIGAYQLRISTVARLRSDPFERDGKWIRLDRDAARQIVADCMTDSLAYGHARRRIREALAVGSSQRLGAFAAAALVYAGELPTTLGTPYQARLQTRFRLRHRSCAPSTQPSRMVA